MERLTFAGSVEIVAQFLALLEGRDLLTYNVPEAWLEGTIGLFEIKCSAGSGGFAGTKTPGKEEWWFKDNIFAAGIAGHGPIPLGTYYMYPHEKKPNMVRLEPDKANMMFGRSGFMIHGRGPVGSEGCIVPYEFKNVVNIYKQVSQYLATNGGKRPSLEVIAESSNLGWQQRVA